MAHEVVFEDDPLVHDMPGNNRGISGASSSMLAWLVEHKIVKDSKQAELFLLGVVVVAVILAIFFFMLYLKGSAARPPLRTIDGTIITNTH
jgi:flagellar biosynthesis/type III secretory pathway M-ring protein FliF/YscJ